MPVQTQANLARFRRGKSIIPQLTSRRLNEQARAVESLRDDFQRHFQQRFPSSRIVESRLAVVTNAGPNSESDFSTSEYWLKFQRSEVDASGNASLVDENAPGIGGIVEATNLSEASDEHGLATDGSVYVRVYLVDHRTFPPTKRWYFEPGGGGSVDVRQNDTIVVSATPYINIKGNGTQNVMKFATDTVSGTNGAKLEFDTTGVSDYKVLQVASGNVLFDWVRAHS